MMPRIILLLGAILVHSTPLCEELVFHLVIQDHLFEPDTITVPAGTRIKLSIDNKDATPEEFESLKLNREKIILGNSSASIYIGPLKAGIYPFFGEFNPETAQGKVIVVAPDDSTQPLRK